MNKNDIHDQIIAHKNNIKAAKDEIQTLAKARDILLAYNGRNSSDAIAACCEAIGFEIEVQKTSISINNESLAKAKKKLALLEKLEALDAE